LTGARLRVCGVARGQVAGRSLLLLEGFSMKMSFSIPPGLAYVDGKDVPDMPEAMSVDDAAYHTAHSFPGGVSALAARMGVSAGTLTHKVNPNNTTHHLSPRELLALQHMSGNAAVLHAMAHSLGYNCTRAIPDQAGGDPVEAFMHLQMAYAELVRSVADPLASRQPGQVTRNEMRRAEAMAAELQACIGNTLGALRGYMRKAPEGQG
jgi:hypothetical protein